jgi:hypothetical protein
MKIAALAVFLVVSAAPAVRAEGFSSSEPQLLSLTPSASLGLDLSSSLLSATGEVATARTTLFGLPRNVGTVDRIIRGVIAAALIGIASYRFATDAPMPGWTAALLAVSVIPASTAAIGYCPLYHAFGWSTDF